MKLSNLSFLAVAVSMTILLGLGCNQKNDNKALTLPSGGSSGPKPLQAAGLSPENLTKKINLTVGNILLMKEKFSGKGATIAKAMGFGGNGIDREVVIKRFAPGQLAELEWKSTYKDEKGADQQKVGALVGANLLSSREMYLPAVWPDGVKNAYGTGMLWLSSDVYENLTKSGLSTFDFGLLDKSIMEQASTDTGLSAALGALQDSVDKISARTDVALTKGATTTSDWPLKVNGVDAKVKVYQAKNWYGEITYLANQQNPLVLKVKMNELPDGSALNGLLDYEIIELRDLQE